MQISELYEVLRQGTEVAAVERCLEKQQHILLSGLHAGARSVVLRQLSEKHNLFIVLDNADEAQYMYADLVTLYEETVPKGQSRVFYFPTSHRRSQATDEAMAIQRTEVLSEIPEKLDFFDELPEYDTALFVHKKSKTDEAGSLEMLKKMLPVFEAIDDWCDEKILNAMTDMAEKCECKNAKVMWPVRIAAAGKAVTPGGAVEICRILGKAETLRRMNIAIEKLENPAR